jgi:hypothetical protein
LLQRHVLQCPASLGILSALQSGLIQVQDSNNNNAAAAQASAAINASFHQQQQQQQQAAYQQQQQQQAAYQQQQAAYQQQQQQQQAAMNASRDRSFSQGSAGSATYPYQVHQSQSQQQQQQQQGMPAPPPPTHPAYGAYVAAYQAAAQAAAAAGYPLPPLSALLPTVAPSSAPAGSFGTQDAHAHSHSHSAAAPFGGSFGGSFGGQGGASNPNLSFQGPLDTSQASVTDRLVAPADAYEVISRKALEAKMLQQSAYSEGAQGQGGLQQSSYPYLFPPGASASMGPGSTGGRSGGRPSTGNASVASRGRPSSAGAPLGRRSLSGGAGVRPSSGAMGLGMHATLGPQAPLSPRSVSSSGVHRPLYGEPGFKPTVAGSANRTGGVYDRLSNPENFTGVYRRAWMTDGRINHFTEVGVSAAPSAFVGNTNTGTNESIKDIRFLLRPNLLYGKGFK